MNTFKWCNYNWKCEMDGGRIIHPDYPWQWYSLDMIKPSFPTNNEELSLHVMKNPKDVKYWNGKIYHPQYEVATMRSIEDFSYGTFSAEIKVPEGKNLSASFWLTGSGNWPPEIDIMEGFLDNTGSWFKCFESYFPWIKLGWRTTTNMHYRDEQLNKTHAGSRNIPYTKQPKDPVENWIEYKCKWEPNKIIFYANNKIVREIKGYECQQMTKNLTNPKKGYKVNVIFNLWVENPDEYNIEIEQPMYIRNFKYQLL